VHAAACCQARIEYHEIDLVQGIVACHELRLIFLDAFESLTDHAVCLLTLRNTLIKVSPCHVCRCGEMLYLVVHQAYQCTTDLWRQDKLVTVSQISYHLEWSELVKLRRELMESTLAHISPLE
jgi:hypothetical protein